MRGRGGAPARPAARARRPAQRKLRRRVGAAHRAQPRHRGEQRARVRLARRGEDRSRPAPSSTFSPRVHHDDAIGDLGDHAHVVRDEDHRHVHLVLQQADQRQDLRLHGHVERGRRLVGDQQRRGGTTAPSRSSRAGACRRRAGADSASAPARASGMRTCSSMRSASARAARAVLALVQPDRLADLVADREHRVERGHRLLEDHRDLGAADAAHRRAVGAREVDARAVAAREIDAARRRCGRRRARRGA